MAKLEDKAIKVIYKLMQVMCYNLVAYVFSSITDAMCEHEFS